MPRVEQSTIIRVPVASVYNLLVDEPERMVEWWPTVEVHVRITPPPTEVGSLFRYVYNIAGIRVKGEHKILMLEPNTHIRFKSISGIDSTFYINLTEEAPNSTRVTIIGDYQIPGSILGQLLNRARVEAENSRNLANGLDRLKMMLETAQPRS